MLTITFDTKLEEVVGVPSWECSPGTVEQTMLALFNTFPQLYVALQTNTIRYIAVLNASTVLQETDKKLQLHPTDEVALLSIPEGDDAVSIGAFVVDMAAEYGVISATMWAAAGTVTYAVIGGIVLAAVTLALSYIMGALASDVEMPSIDSGSLNNSATYTFDGIKNTTASGTPIAVVYGTHRTGGHLLGVRVRST